MNVFRSIALAAGVALGAIGVAIMFVPGLTIDFQVASVFVAAIATVALLLGFYLVVMRFGVNHQRQRLRVPAPEGRSYPTPGEEIDRHLASLSMLDRQNSEPSTPRTSVRSRVEHAAIAVLTRYGAITEEQAREQLAQGSWTDDSQAAAFFADDLVPRLSTREQLRQLRTGEPTIRRRARHAIAALDRRLHEDRQGTLTTTDRTHQDNRSSVSVQSLPDWDEDETTDEEDDTVALLAVGESIERSTDRWQGITAVALLAGATGMILRRPSLLLASVIGVACAAYARTAALPPVDLDIERAVSNTCPDVDEEVEVTVTVRNRGDSLLPDCCLIDGVPRGLVVAEGSPRHGTALRPGKVTTFSYTVAAARGEHTFEPTLVIARDFSASVERLTRVAASEQTTVTYVPPLQPLDRAPLRMQADRFGGHVATDSGGSGVEFYATREYRQGDPRSRIDWNRLARTGDLSTLVFREERTATVMLVIDARPEAYLAPPENSKSASHSGSAVERSIEVGGRLFATFAEEGTRVGVTALSFDGEPCWIDPGAGDAHRARVRQLFAMDPALSSTPPKRAKPDRLEVARPFDRVDRRLPPDAQIIVLTPLCDDTIASWIRRLDARGHSSTVISPDPTTLDTPGRQIAHVERAIRLTNLRRAGIPVLNRVQGSDESLSIAIDGLRTQRRVDVMSRRRERGSESL